MARARKIGSRKSQHQGTSAPAGRPSTSGSSSQPGGSLLRRSGIPALIFVCTITVYCTTFQNGYVWDDNIFVTDNASLRTLQGLKQIWLEPRTQVQYYPITLTSFWIEYHLWGPNPAGYHVVNVLLHAINSILVWLILVRLGVPGAPLGALLFALHPVQVESVAWIAERKNILAGTFYLLTILSWLRFAKSGRWSDYALVVLFFIAGCLGKILVATLVPIFVLWIWWKQNNSWRRYAPWLAPLVAIAVAIGLVAVWHEKLLTGSEEGFGRNLTFLHSTIIAGRALWFYVGQLLFPVGLTAIYPKWVVEPTSLLEWLYPATVLAVLAVLWHARNRLGKGPLVAALVFILGHSLTLTFVDYGFLGHSYVADRFQYFPSMALLALLGSALVQGAARFVKSMTWIPIAAGAAVCMVLGIMSLGQTRAYRDAETFWEHNLLMNPTHTAYSALGDIYLAKGDVQKAQEYQLRSLAIGESARGHFRLGLVYVKEKQDEKALAEYLRALELARRDNIKVSNLVPPLLFNIGWLYWKKGDLEKCADAWREAARESPNMKEVREWLPRVEERLQKSKGSAAPVGPTGLN